MAVITELKWASMTAAINKMKSPNIFLQRLLYGNHQPVSTETIEVDSWVRGRFMAPFITKGADPTPITGPSQTKAIIEAPNIRIYKTLDPSELLFGRTPGSVIFPSRGGQRSAIREHVAKELQPLADDVANRLEWMVAQTLTGTLTYSVTTGDAFTVDYQRLAGHTVDLSGDAALKWNGTAPDMLQDFKNCKRTMTKEGFQPTDAIFSPESSDSFQNDAEVRKVLDQQNVAAGGITFLEQFSQDGVLFLGTVAGIRCWEYNRSAFEPDGTEVQMIRAKHVEFVSRTPAADFVVYYGAIPDMEALEANKWVGERFSKTIMNKKTGTMDALVHTRPMPVPRRPSATYSLETNS